MGTTNRRNAATVGGAMSVDADTEDEFEEDEAAAAPAVDDISEAGWEGATGTCVRRR